VLIDLWLLACADVAVLEVNEGHWRFAHDNTANNCWRAFPSRTASASPEVAEAIETLYPDVSERAADLANHWRVVGDASLERQYNAMAGEQALIRGANHDAVSFTNVRWRWRKPRLLPKRRASNSGWVMPFTGWAVRMKAASTWNGR